MRRRSGSFEQNLSWQRKSRFDWKRSSKVSFLWLTFFFVSLYLELLFLSYTFLFVAIKVYFCLKISYCSFMAVGESIRGNDRFAAVPHKLFVYENHCLESDFNVNSGNIFIIEFASHFSLSKERKSYYSLWQAWNYRFSILTILRAAWKIYEVAAIANQRCIRKPKCDTWKLLSWRRLMSNIHFYCVERAIINSTRSRVLFGFLSRFSNALRARIFPREKRRTKGNIFSFIHFSLSRQDFHIFLFSKIVRLFQGKEHDKENNLLTLSQVSSFASSN